MAVTRNSFIANHRVALAGTKERSAVSTWRVEYVATRPGAVREATPADRLLDGQRRELGLVAYMDERPGAVRSGGTALFDQDGPVALADARRAIERCGGAVCCTVLSVRRDDAEALGLTSKEEWERFVRQGWQQEFAAMANIPESRVHYVAAFHLNSPASYHVHILSWDSDPVRPWNSILQKARMELAREHLTDAALAPVMRRLDAERTLARDDAVRILRGMDGGGLERGVSLPADGSLDYGHLRRYHPEVARQVREAVDRALESAPQLSDAVARHSESVRLAAELRGLVGTGRDSYIADARRDLERRMCNAAVSAMRPDRSALPREGRQARYRLPDGPSASRRRERSLCQEVEACVVGNDRATLLAAMAGGAKVPEETLRCCPTVAARMRSGHDVANVRLPSRAARLAGEAVGAEGCHADAGEEAGRKALRILSRSLAHAFALMPGGKQTTPAPRRPLTMSLGG